MTEKRTEKSGNDMWFVYDGECPICTLGASLYKLRQSIGQLHTVDARTEKQHPVMYEVNQAGLNLDDGMVIKYEGRLYQGEDALHLMARLGDSDGVFNKINNSLFKSRQLVTLCYPGMKMVRNLALWFKGVPAIRNLDSHG